MSICSSLSFSMCHINGMDGFVQIYDPMQGDIVSIECTADKSGTIIKLLTWSNTKIRDLRPAKFDAGHVGVCGMVFYDSKYYYTSWGGAIFCLSMEDDSQIWRYNAKGHGGEIMLSEDNAIIVLCDDAIYKLNPITGSLIARQPNSSESFLLSKKYVFYGPVRNSYYILDVTTMKTIQAIDKARVYPSINNIHICISYAFLYGKQITIHGFYYRHDEKASKPTRFTSVIDTHIDY